MQNYYVTGVLPALIAEKTSVKKENIFNATRGKQEMAIARQLYCYICYQHFEHTFADIGKFIGRHHTTIIHSVRHVTHMLEIKDPYYLRPYEQIMKKLEEDKLSQPQF